MNLSGETLLVVAPHPDDEVLGCGGLIRKVKKAGGKVFVLIVCVGNIEQIGGKSDVGTRKKEIEAAMSALDVDEYDLAFADDKYHLKLDTIPQIELIGLIENSSKVSFKKVNPTIVALPFKSSSNQDHRAVFEAGFSALRPRPGRHSPGTVLMYEQPDVYWGMESFTPNFFVDIEDELEEKVAALKAYKSQVHKHPHPVSIENIRTMAHSRGISVGKPAVEAYVCLRIEW